VTAILERDRELAELDALVAEAHGGRGCFAVIEAIAGLGKTRLLQAARERGRAAGMQVLTARATELERDFPFALARQLFEPHLAALDEHAREALFDGAAGAARGALGLTEAAPTGGAPDTFAVLHGLYWLTAALADQQPLLLAIDDAHWSDAASLDYLGFLLPRLEELPLLLAIACRPDEANAETSLARIATDGLAHRLTPRPLSRSAAVTLLSTELDEAPDGAFAATCHEVSGGNPFLLHELARTVAAEAISPVAEQAPRVHELAPERVARTVLVRLARLSPEAQAVARALVVLADDADHRLVAELAGLDADTTLAGADELRRAAIVDPAASALRFVHPLVRTVLHHELPAGERAAAHARAAELLRARGASAQQLAPHLVATEARGDRATAETLLEAGGAALASGASRAATAYLTRALREPAPADLRPGILGALLDAGMRLMDPTVFAGIEADVRAELERDPQLLAAWADQIAPWLAIARRTEETEALLDDAIAVVERTRDVDRALHLEGQRIAYLQLDPAAARPRIERYRARVEPGGPGDRLLAAFGASWSLFDGTAAEAAPLARRALSGGRIFIERSELLIPGEVLRAAILAGELNVAQQAIDQALALAREHGGLWEQVGAWYLHAHVMLARGDLAAAQADVEQMHAMATTSRSLSAAPMVAAILVTILRERGTLEEAQAELAHAAADGAIEDLPAFDPLLFARAELHLACGRMREAADDFQLLGARRRNRGTATSPIMQVDACAARALVALGEREQAGVLAESALADARRWGGPAPLARALRAVATTLPGTTRLEPLREAVAVLDGSGAQLDRAYALAELGAALRRANNRADARAPLRDALELARRCGATGLAKQTFEELQATGEKVRRWTPIGVESLTPSERRVAEMAANGMTNRQIAQALFLTVKTIETHLAATYDKLAIRSRRELPEALGERRPDVAATATAS
jgi:DNA-binding CsgD family transcriptional regulator